MQVQDDENGAEWKSYRVLILAEIKRINDTVNAISTDMQALKIAVAILQLKASAWGALAGAVVAVGVILIKIASGNP